MATAKKAKSKPIKKAPAKKPANSRKTAPPRKKATVKKTAVRETAAKKPAVKKTAASKPAVKKTAAKPAAIKNQRCHQPQCSRAQSIHRQPPQLSLRPTVTAAKNCNRVECPPRTAKPAGAHQTGQ